MVYHRIFNFTLTLAVLVTIIAFFLCSTGFADLPEGTIFHMNFNDDQLNSGGGNTVTDWANENDGQISGTPQWVDGQYGGALRLNGTNNRVTVPSADPLPQLSHPMTVMAWVNPEALSGFRNIVEMDGGNAADGWKLGFNGNKVLWTHYRVQDFTGQTVVNTGGWTHIAATWDGTAAKIYVNGNLDSGAPIESTATGLEGKFYQLTGAHTLQINARGGPTLSRVETGVFQGFAFRFPFPGVPGILPTLTKVFPTIRFPNTGGEFKHHNGSGTGRSEFFYARFTGFIWIPSPGNYQFHVGSDDGFRLKIDGSTVIQHQNPRGFAEMSGSKNFTSAGMYPIELSFYEWTGGAGLTLKWTPPGGNKRIIPKGNLMRHFISVSNVGRVPSLDIGYRRTGNNAYFRGGVDDLWIFDKVKSRSEIRAIMNKPDPLFTNALGSNNKFNVAINDSVRFTVDVNTPSGASIDRYSWKWEAGSQLPSGFDVTTNPEKNYSFSDPGDYSVYSKVIDDNGIESDLIKLQVRAWNRPVVQEAPPAAAIPANASEISQANKASWLANKYVGVKGQPVKLRANASLEGNEAIDRYIWDFDNNWDTIELTQPANDVATYTWDSANLSGRIKCKAVSNYGIESDEKLFDLKIYETVQVNPGGPYNGRPNRPVVLEGAINTINYPGSTFAYQWRVKSGNTFADVTTTNDGNAEYK